MRRTYNFVEIPLVGYVLHEDSFTFGYKEYFSAIDYDVKIYTTNKNNVSKLEELINKEISKGDIKTVTEGVGAVKGDFYFASRISSIFVAFSLEDNSLMQMIIPLILIPGPVYPFLGAYIFKRFGEKKALEQMKMKLSEHVVEYDASEIYKKMEDLNLKQKVHEYAQGRRQGSWWQRTKRIWKLEPELEAKRASVAKDLDSLIALTSALGENAKEKFPYEIATQTYSFIRGMYNYSWWQKGTPIVFGW